jgi:hypothetical protein
MSPPRIIRRPQGSIHFFPSHPPRFGPTDIQGLIGVGRNHDARMPQVWVIKVVGAFCPCGSAGFDARNQLGVDRNAEF